MDAYINIFLALLLLLHTFADFTCQTRWMGDNKWENIRALLAHVGTYTFVFTLGVCVLSRLMFPMWNLETVFAFCLANGLIHLIVDSMSSRLSHKLAVVQKWYPFWNVIGYDQWLHCGTIILLAGYFFS